MTDLLPFSSTFTATPLVAILRGVDAKVVPQVAEALRTGGITVLEVTLNSDGALEAIRELKRRFAGMLSIGAGTVLEKAQVGAAADAGAEFLVTPTVDADVLADAAQRRLPVVCGALTPTEILAAHRGGAQYVKLFPAASLGASYLREVRGPLSQVNFIAVGGITLDNAPSFLEAGAVGLGLGGSLIHPADLANGDFEAIRERAAAFVRLLRGRKR